MGRILFDLFDDENIKIRVVSKRKGGIKADRDEVVIDGDRSSQYFGNPYILENHADTSRRNEVINLYIKNVLIKDIELKGKVYKEMEKIAKRLNDGEKIALSCWCAPKRCHCDYIVKGIRCIAEGKDITNFIEKLKSDII